MVASDLGPSIPLTTEPRPGPSSTLTLELAEAAGLPRGAVPVRGRAQIWAEKGRMIFGATTGPQPCATCLPPPQCHEPCLCEVPSGRCPCHGLLYTHSGGSVLPCFVSAGSNDQRGQGASSGSHSKSGQTTRGDKKMCRWGPSEDLRTWFTFIFSLFLSSFPFFFAF